MSKDETLLSAQVALRPDAVMETEQVRKIFADEGFAVGPVVANNFSITAPATEFEKFFKTRVKSSTARDVQFASSEAAAEWELRGEDLAPALRDSVDRIVVSKPPDFGPFNP